MVAGGIIAGSAGPTFFGIAAGIHIWNKYGLKATRNLGMFGMGNTGRSCMWAVLNDEDGEAIYDFERNETLEPQGATVAKISGAKKKFKGEDFPRDIELIPIQLETYRPAWIIIVVDVFTCYDPKNYEVIRAVCEWLSTPEYIGAHSPKYFIHPSIFHPPFVQRRIPFTGTKGCQLVTIVLNKTDELQHWPQMQRGWTLQQVGDAYMKRSPSNPLELIRGRIKIEFIAASLFHGKYWKYPDFYADHEPLKDYFIDVSGRI